MTTRSKPLRTVLDAAPRQGRCSVRWGFALALCVLVQCVSARAEVRLFEQEPYDRITLDAANDNTVLDVFPLDLPGRKLPEKKPPSGKKLAVRLLDRPDTPYEVRWGSIAKVELFESRILGDATALVKAGRFEDAYDYFDFLRKRYPETVGLAKALEDYLYEQAKVLHSDKKYDAALGMLRELYGRNKDRPEVERALGLSTEKLVEKYVAADDYRAARQLLRNLAAWYPEHKVVVDREKQFREKAAGLKSEAESAVAAGDLRKADQAVRMMARVWPDPAGGVELLDSIRRKYPRVVVGVIAPAVVSRPAALDDWAARRSGRLLYRTLSEFIGPGTDGGRYRCPVGAMRIEALGRRLAFRIDPGIRWPVGNVELTGLDVSRQLLAMADSGRPEYREDWARLLAGVVVRDVYDVDANLTRTHVRPDALLQTILVPPGPRSVSEEAASTIGPYTILSQTAEEVCYVAKKQYFAATPTQPKEIVERTYTRGVEAIRDLKRGKIDILDRVSPWEVPRLRDDPSLVVEPYGVPLVHVLVPNMRKPLLARRRFRRALVYAIHREAILSHLLGDRKVTGCRVTSGPFPIGVAHDDPLSYAYDRSLAPRPYDPRLAIALARVALDEVAAAEKKRGREMTGMPQLVLVHPPSEIAQSACRVIQRQLKAVGIGVTLKQEQPGRMARDPGAWDLAYAELAMWEPVVDAARLLGRHGPPGGCSPYMSLVLARLQRAAQWDEVHKLLPLVHRIAHDDVAIVPLWQMVEHLAYRKGLGGVGTQPILLYEGVEQWETAAPARPEKP